MPKPFSIELRIGTEGRECEQTFDTFKSAREFAIDHAIRHPGVEVKVNVSVSASPIHYHTHNVFVCYQPRLDDWQAAEIEKAFGPILET